jgi:hypothetical protein
MNRWRAFDNSKLCFGAGDVTPQVARRLSDQDIMKRLSDDRPMVGFPGSLIHNPRR